MAVRNVTKNYPLTAMIHGTTDTDVPYKQSTIMADQFKKQSVEYQMLSVPNSEQGLGGGKKEDIEGAYERGF